MLSFSFRRPVTVVNRVLPSHCQCILWRCSRLLTTGETTTTKKSTVDDSPVTTPLSNAAHTTPKSALFRSVDTNGAHTQRTRATESTKLVESREGEKKVPYGVRVLRYCFATYALCRFMTSQTRSGDVYLRRAGLGNAVRSPLVVQSNTVEDFARGAVSNMADSPVSVFVFGAS